MYIYNVTQCNVIVNEHLVQQYGMVRYSMVCIWLYVCIYIYNYIICMGTYTLWIYIIDLYCHTYYIIVRLWLYLDTYIVDPKRIACKLMNLRKMTNVNSRTIKSSELQLELHMSQLITIHPIHIHYIIGTFHYNVTSPSINHLSCDSWGPWALLCHQTWIAGKMMALPSGYLT